MDAYFNDVSLLRIFALFGPHKYIQNAKHLSDIAGISEVEAMDKLECLKNLSLLGVNEKGYFNKTNHIEHIPTQSKKIRVKQHSMRLMQVASLYPETEKFCDDFLAASTSEQLMREFYEKIALAKSEFIAKTNQLKAEEKSCLLTFALGFLVDEIDTDKGASND